MSYGAIIPLIFAIGIYGYAIRRETRLEIGFHFIRTEHKRGPGKSAL